MAIRPRKAAHPPGDGRAAHNNRVQRATAPASLVENRPLTSSIRLFSGVVPRSVSSSTSVAPLVTSISHPPAVTVDYHFPVGIEGGSLRRSRVPTEISQPLVSPSRFRGSPICPWRRSPRRLLVSFAHRRWFALGQRNSSYLEQTTDIASPSPSHRPQNGG